MSKKKDKPIKLSEIKPEEQLKYEIATELGLLDKVLATGWKSLSAKESGRVGGILAARKKALAKEAAEALKKSKEEAISHLSVK
ncbi:small, acid-soluble spore protein, alpha/beta type [Anaerolentibacter hominis]|uniref:small, acid-soluble spore protein, alpha/beta type n=1 Tax=Anaerolentibacter hominis TaxID=3079009 RepID=UPI0031B84933